MNEEKINKRRFLKGLGAAGAAGVTASLAGCNEQEGSTDDTTTNQNDTKEEEISLEEAFQVLEGPQDADLTDASLTNPRTADNQEIILDPDLSEIEDYQIEIKFSNDIVNNTVTYNPEDLTETTEGLLLELPENLLPARYADIEIGIKGENVSQEYRVNVETPDSFQVTGNVYDNVPRNEEAWQFADIERQWDKAQEEHLDFIRERYVSPRNDHHVPSIDEIATNLEIDPEEDLNQEEFEEILDQYASGIREKVNENRGGVNQSARHLGHELQNVVEEELDRDVRNIVRTAPNGNNTPFIADMETGTIYRITNRGHFVRADEVDGSFGGISIFDYEPGETEGVNYDSKKHITAHSMLTPTMSQSFGAVTTVASDYALETISEHFMDADGDAEAMREIMEFSEVWTSHIESLNYEDGERVVEESRFTDDFTYVGPVANQGDSLQDIEFIATNNNDLREELMEDPMPVSKDYVKRNYDVNFIGN